MLTMVVPRLRLVVIFLLSLLVSTLVVRPLLAVELMFDYQSRFSAEQKKQLKTWLEQGKQAVENSIAPIPQQQLKVTLVQQKTRTEVVPWGQIVRGNPDSVKLHVSDRASLYALTNDWTLYHELSHLYLPYLDYPSFWLNEGFATYMQYIVMYQAGLLSRKRFIARVKAGFERGRRKTLTKPGKLNRVSADMWRLRAHKRVYWTGAAYFLEADLALQQRSNKLANVIAAYSDCCRRDNSSGIYLARQLDRLSDSKIFSQLFNQYRERTDFPVVTNEQLEKIADFYQPNSR